VRRKPAGTLKSGTAIDKNVGYFDNAIFDPPW
jgi:hypothetical protein